MKIFQRSSIASGLAVCAVIVSVAISGCKKDDPVVNSRTYDLQVVDQLVSGTVTFTETSSGVTTIAIDMAGGDANAHPAHPHVNSAVEGGAIAISLNDVVNGKSSTEVTQRDNNTSISYDRFVAFDGYLNVHQSATDLGSIIGQTDIGGNALTNSSTTYDLEEVTASGVSGTAVFAKRENGLTLVTINLNGTIAGDSHPAVIHIGSVETVGGGPASKHLNAVDGTSGKSITNVRTLNDNTPITYDGLMAYDGYLAIHRSALLMEVVLCQDNIGSNN